jgi:hypothetical protein
MCDYKIIILLFLLLLVLIGIFICLIKWGPKALNSTVLGGAVKIIAQTQSEEPIDILNNPDDILNVFLDERNFYYLTRDLISKRKKTNKTRNSKKDKYNTPLSLLKKYLHKKYPTRRIKMHIITKNTNQIDYIDELDEYENRYDWGEDSLYIANTTFDTEIISQTSKNHHLRGRDDLLALILALEHLDKGENILIISNDKYRDFNILYEMPEFNMIHMYKNQINKRHINPAKFRFTAPRFKKIIDEYKIEIPDLSTI